MRTVRESKPRDFSGESPLILSAQNRTQVIVHERRADGSFTESEHDGGAVELPAINCTLPIAEVYEDLPIAST
jgi:hypothetical protein